LLGVNQPSASVGHILTQSLKPAAEVTYPKPIPVRTRRGAHVTTNKGTGSKGTAGKASAGKASAAAKTPKEQPQP
jgi:hypothetical protein